MTKRTNPPPFTAETARRAQPLAVRARRAMDERLRADLAHRLPAMRADLLREAVDLLPIRQVERLRRLAMGG